MKKKIRLGAIVVVDWVDACADDDAELTLHQAQKQDAAPRKSYGILVTDDAKKVNIAPHVGLSGEQGVLFMGVLSIPKGMVTKIKEVK